MRVEVIDCFCDNFLSLQAAFMAGLFRVKALVECLRQLL